MQMFINGTGIISPQQTWEGPLLSSPLSYAGSRLVCVEPDYSSYIDAKAIRRMSRIIRMGVASASIALREADIRIPEGIITATGYGCLEDTGIFLTKMHEMKEQALNPTPFIQSTHNTIGSQIALLLQCQQYNQTYTQGGFSFENALLDAMLHTSEIPAANFLVGGMDEITDTSHSIMNRFGLFRQNSTDSLRLFESDGEGTVHGEGSTFLLVSGIRSQTSLAFIHGVEMLYKPSPAELGPWIREFLLRNNAGDIDLVLSGGSGDSSNDGILTSTLDENFNGRWAPFKQLCGEFAVASAFACGIAARILRSRKLPQVLSPAQPPASVRQILIINQYFGKQYSLILLRAC